MTQPEPATETIDANAAREQWASLLDRARSQEARFLIECDGKPVAALMSAHDLEMYEMLLEAWDKNGGIIEEIQQLFVDIPDEELEREVEKAIAEVRAEAREHATRAAVPTA